MLRVLPAMSNAERQREFRAAHPGYFRKYRNRHKALTRAEQNALFLAQWAATEAAMVATADAAGAGTGGGGDAGGQGLTPSSQTAK
jgi:hypothetical protein